MPELSLRDIDQISRDVTRQEITFSHLLEELIDHLCCDVENEMKKGSSFAEAYRDVKQRMGSRRLKEIQEETLYSVDTKYRKMKNTMKISGIAGTVILGFASLFKISHLSGAGFMLTIGALVLALIFLPSALVVLWKETHSGKRLYSFISAFIAGTFFIFGMLFKVQHWPWANIMIILAVISGDLFFIPSLLISKLRDQESRQKRPVYILGAAGAVFYITGFLFKILHWPAATLLVMIGLFTLFVIVLPWYTWITWRQVNSVSVKFIFIIITPLLLIVPGVLVNLNMQKIYDDGFYVQMEQQQVWFRYKEESIAMLLNSYHDSIQSKEMEQLHLKTKDLMNLINRIEGKMVEESEGIRVSPESNISQIRQTDNGIEIQYRLLTKPFHSDPVKDFLLKGSSSRQELDAALSGYMIFLTDLTPVKEPEKYKKLLDPSTYLPGDNPRQSEMVLITGLHSLGLLRNGVLDRESYALKTIAGN
jgi:hypothetical protein